LALCNEVYELAHHRTISHNAGMSDADIDAAIAGSASLAPFEQTLAKAAEELVRDQNVSDATWAELAKRYSQIELMEAVGLVAAYTALAMLFKSYGVQLEDADTFGGFQQQREYT
jgi:alkylhydroperoxidase family enzyme